MAQSKKKKTREIALIKVLPVFGTTVMFQTIAEAIAFIKEQPEEGIREATPLVRFEVEVRFTDGIRMTGEFPNKYGAVEYLKNRMKGLL